MTSVRRIILIVSLVLLLVLPTNSCSLFKSREVHTTIDKAKTEAKSEVVKEQINHSVDTKAGTSESKRAVYNEEITLKKYNSNSEPIELTATFRVDTTASLRGDTALKLVDINNGSTSVAIYQNKRTNELMAKVTTKGSTTNVPFSELQIKRNFQENLSKSDTTKSEFKFQELKVDSSGHTKNETFHKDKDVEVKPTPYSLVAYLTGLAILVLGGFYFLKKYNPFNLLPKNQTT